MARLVCVCAVLGLSATGFRVSKRRSDVGSDALSEELVKSLGLTSEEVDSLDWAGADKVKCAHSMAKCKANQSECSIPCSVVIGAPRGSSNGPPELEEPAFGVQSDLAMPGVGDMVAVGQLAWQVIQDGKPSTSLTSSSVSVKRKDTDFSQYYGWKSKEAPYVRVAGAVNGFGFETGHVELKLKFLYNGQVEVGPSGKQVRYIQNMFAFPDVDADWPLGISANAQRGEPINWAGRGTHACAQMSVNYLMTFSGPFDSWTVAAETMARCDGAWLVTPK